MDTGTSPVCVEDVEDVHVHWCPVLHGLCPCEGDGSSEWTLVLGHSAQQISFLSLSLSLCFVFVLFKNFCFYFFGSPEAYVVNRPGIRSEPQLQPMPELWQCWILNLLCWQGIEPSAPETSLHPIASQGKLPEFF